MKMKNSRQIGRETLLYLVFGFLTTVISVAVFWLCQRASLSAVPANTVSTAAAILFAFITNKIIVFEHKSASALNLLAEFLKFCLGRLATYLLETFLLWVAVDNLRYNGAICKLATTALVIALNYFISKLLVFRKRG